MTTIRPARLDETEFLSDLALRSKAYWGYSPEFLEACREELTITRQRIEDEMVRVAEAESGIITGFYSLTVAKGKAELVDLFVDPPSIGSGVGTRLWDHAVAEARAVGATTMRIEADPKAEPWYRRRGATPAGRAPSGCIPGRTLPVLAYTLVPPPSLPVTEPS